MRHSDQLDKLAVALAKAQADLPAAKKSGINPHFKSRFATLEDVWNAAHGPLAANGLSVYQTTEHTDDAGLNVVTMLLHTSGQFICGEVRIPLPKADAQSVGSAISYGRRYGLGAALGIVTDEDDDGNAATGRQAEREPAPARAPSPRQTPPPPPRAESRDGDVRWPYGRNKGKPLSEFTAEELESSMAWLTADPKRATDMADLVDAVSAQLDHLGVPR